MRTFLGVLMVLFVSGEEETVTGVLEGSVLLPCNCSERDLNQEFKWQMDEPNMTVVLQHRENTTNFKKAYGNRTKIFLAENSNNCSILLTNITAKDHGKYRCKFFSDNIHQKRFVHLSVSASYNICQPKSSSNLNNNLNVKVFQCDAKGHYGEAEIQWILDGKFLTDSPTTNITLTKTLDAPAGLYSFTSMLNTSLTVLSEPKCNIKAKGISTIITHDCGTDNEPAESQPRTHDPKPEDSMRYRYLVIFPFMLVLGFSLVLWHSWKFSKSSREMPDVVAVNL